jgi:predicted peroxiredoxin
MPEMMDLLEGFQALGGRILICELAFEAKDMKEEELREGTEVVGATTFLTEIQDSTIQLCF